MTRCNHCGGTMHLVSPAHPSEEPELIDKATGKGWNRICLLCGRDNRPPVSTEAILARRLPPRDYTPQPDDTPRRGRPPSKVNARNRARDEKDSDYRKFLGVISTQIKPWLTRDLAAIMGKHSLLVAAWVRRAAHDRWVRSLGKVYVARDDDWRKHCVLTKWETVR